MSLSLETEISFIFLCGHFLASGRFVLVPTFGFSSVKEHPFLGFLRACPHLNPTSCAFLAPPPLVHFMSQADAGEGHGPNEFQCLLQ